MKTPRMRADPQLRTWNEVPFQRSLLAGLLLVGGFTSAGTAGCRLISTGSGLLIALGRPILHFPIPESRAIGEPHLRLPPERRAILGRIYVNSDYVARLDCSLGPARSAHS